MRKLMVLPLAGMLALGVVGPVAAAPNVSNTSGTGVQIYGDWSSEGVYGFVAVTEDSQYGTYGELYQETGEWVECPAGSEGGGKGGVVAEDTTPGGEYYGFVGSRTYGNVSDIHIELSRRFETGHATGTVELFTETVNECTGEYGGDPVVDTGSFEVTVTGVGPLASIKGSGSYKVPSEFNSHQSYRAKERSATGSVVAGTTIDRSFDSAYMTQVTWSDHTNQ